MTRPIDISGKKFGKLTAVSLTRDAKGYRAWNVRCDCGTDAVYRTCDLTSGNNSSCGCAPRGPQRRPPAERFWENVDKSAGPTECWPWTASLYTNGYGSFAAGGRYGGCVRAHRAAWGLTNGEIPDGLVVCHSCDNRRCVNPAHLFLGTRMDNVRDMCAKGRQTRGEKNAASRLTERDVRSIRALRAKGLIMREIAAEFGVTRKAVELILHGHRWAHVTDAEPAQERQVERGNHQTPPQAQE